MESESKLNYVLNLVNLLDEEFCFGGIKQLQYNDDKQELYVGDKVYKKSEFLQQISENYTEEQIMDLILDTIMGIPYNKDTVEYLKESFDKKVEKRSLSNAVNFFKRIK